VSEGWDLLNTMKRVLKKKKRSRQSCRAFHKGSTLTSRKASPKSTRIDSCITQLKAQGPSRTCNESKEEEEEHSHNTLVMGRSCGC